MERQATDTRELRDRLVAWTVRDAFPLWSTHGVDRVRGGFHEALGVEGAPLDLPRRARVQPRQVVAFASAPGLGWDGPAGDLAAHGLAGIERTFRRPDGLLRTRVAPDGTVLDDEAVLYDHTFLLLAHARFGHDEGRGLRSSESRPLPLLANPHMHLLEACLAWIDAGGDARWGALADTIATVALAHMIDGRYGAIHEVFAADWTRTTDLAGRLIEPGHQYEWAWLLMRWGQLRGRDDAVAAALRMIDFTEAHGIDPVREVGYEAITDDLAVHAPVGRTWPQTERIKAGLLARDVTGDARFGAVARRGGDTLLRFLDMAVPGLWRDRLHADGRWGDDPVPASTFYHIVVAAEELQRLG